jgi:mono/diheme cytochrome c family protein
MKRVPVLGASLCLAVLLPLSFGQKEEKKKVVGDPKTGAKIFAANCAECHNADSKEPKEGPGLKGVKDGMLPSGDPATQEEILKLLEEGREEMPPFADLTDEQKHDVSAYVLTL